MADEALAINRQAMLEKLNNMHESLVETQQALDTLRSLTEKADEWIPVECGEYGFRLITGSASSICKLPGNIKQIQRNIFPELKMEAKKLAKSGL